MQFLNPAAFYLLGVIPIVVALHFLKLRRHTHRVPSIMLWLATAEDRRANVPFQRLRNLLLPILQVLFLLLVIFSAARPALRRPGFIPGRAILIVDNSATMLSTETGKTRLDLAKQAARKHIEEITAGAGMMLMITSTTESDAYIREVSFTTDTAKLRDAIENIPKSDIPRNLRPVFNAAARYVESPQDQVFLISDNFENLPETSLSIHKIGVGAEAENIGIVHFNVEIVGDQYEVLVDIQNFTDTVREVEVKLAVENATFDSKTVSIPAKEAKPVLFSDDPEGLVGQVIRVHLPVADDFALDNSAAAVLSGVSQLRILLVSDNQKSLLPTLLETYGEHVDLHQVVPKDYIGTGNADIAIFDGSTPAGREALARSADAAPGTHLIFINPGNDLPFIGEADGDVKKVDTPVQVIETAEAHPLMTGVSLQEVGVLRSTYRTLPLSGRALVETEEGVLIWIAQVLGRQFLVFEFDAFNLEVSNFARTIPDAPLFVYQSLARFAAGTAPLRPLEFTDGQTRHAFRTGEPVSITPIAEGATLHIEKPDTKRIKIADTLFTETDQVGVYTLYVDERPLERFTVNLLDADTSALSYAAATPQTNTSASIENGLQPMIQEVWRFPALLACILLLLEWWFYHREGVFVRRGFGAVTP